MTRNNTMTVKTIIAAAVAISVLSSGPALAGRFEAEGEGKLAAPITEIEINVNPELINDRPSSLALQRSFTRDPWPVSTREAEKLVNGFREDLERELSESGVYTPVGEAGGATLRITIEDVNPSQLNFTDAGFRAGFRNGSYARGGAKVTAVLVDANGEELRQYEYRRFDDGFGARYAIGSYSEAERTLDRFSGKVARDLEGKGS